MKKNTLLYLLPLLAACTESLDTDLMLSHSPMPMELTSVYPSRQPTRATIDGGFVAGDEMGIFVADYDEKGQPTTPQLQGGRASNTRFVLQPNGNWTTNSPVYWNGQDLASDIYGYYPYTEQLTSLATMAFAIEQQQQATVGTTGATGYNNSDLLIAKAEKVLPRAEKVVLEYRHVMAGVTIRLEEGTGFAEGEWGMLSKNVLLENTITSGTVNLTTGETAVSSTGKPRPVSPLYYGQQWRAVVFPQTVDEGKQLVSVTVDGLSYHLSKDTPTTFTSGKMHTFTITVNRRTSTGDYELLLAEEDVSPWQDDAQIHDGIVRQYIIVDVEKEGRLQSVIQQKGLDYQAIANLKVRGNINLTDLEFMGQQMTRLTNLDLSDANIIGGVLKGFLNHRDLQHLIFPKKGVHTIGFRAFEGTGLMGSLTIPEGVTLIEENAFWGCKFTGTLTLPSTIREIRGAESGTPFSGCRFTGELRLPEGLERVTGDMFSWASMDLGPDFTGRLVIPSSLKPTDCHLGFPNMTGDIVIPDGWTEIPSEIHNGFGIFMDGGFDGNVVLPDGLQSIGASTFRSTKIRGEVNIPQACGTIGESAFSGTRIRHLFLPTRMKYIGVACFRDCTRLTGTVSWPDGVYRVNDYVFSGCEMLQGIILPEEVGSIGVEAFSRCFNLQSIVCLNDEPPMLGRDAFLGVNKTDVIVKVPRRAVQRYKQTEGWSDFKRIVAQSDFDCQPASVCALNKEHQEQLVLYAQGEWRVTHQPEWCRLSQTTGTGKTELQLTISQLPHGAAHRRDSIVFEQPKDGYSAWCTLSQYDYQHEEDACLALQEHSQGGGIDIVFAGDGYDAATIASGEYLDIVRYQTECFFAIEPYRSMRQYFNVYATFPMSQEIGINTMSTNVNNHFATLCGKSELNSFSSCPKCTNNNIITDKEALIEYVSNHTPLAADRQRLQQALIILIPNTLEFEGNTVLDKKTDMAIAICPPSQKTYPHDTRGTVQHEAGGHGFGKLGEELIVYPQFATEKVVQTIDSLHERGWYQNLSCTGKMNDVPWASFIFNPQYSSRVDVFEGGYMFMRGIYRPESNSCMNNNIPYYNTPSRFAIWRRIKEYAGESWTMEEFRAQDTFEWGPTTITVP